VENEKSQEASRLGAVVDKEMEKLEKWCGKEGVTRDHPKTREEDRKSKLKDKMTAVNKWGREVNKRARLAKGTRDLECSRRDGHGKHAGNTTGSGNGNEEVPLGTKGRYLCKGPVDGE